MFHTLHQLKTLDGRWHPKIQRGKCYRQKHPGKSYRYTRMGSESWKETEHSRERNLRSQGRGWPVMSLAARGDAALSKYVWNMIWRKMVSDPREWPWEGYINKYINCHVFVLFSLIKFYYIQGMRGRGKNKMSWHEFTESCNGRQMATDERKTKRHYHNIQLVTWLVLWSTWYNLGIAIKRKPQ